MKNLKKAMKNFKKVRLSLGMKIIALLSCVALLSMGFASWWIIDVQGAPNAVSGNFTAYEVITQTVEIHDYTIGTTDKPSTIIFGSPKEKVASITTPWLRDESLATENLETEFSVRINAVADKQNTAAASLDTLINNPVMSLAAKGTNAESVLENAISSGYITLQASYKIYATSDTSKETVLGSSTAPVSFTSADTTDTKLNLEIDLPENQSDITVVVTITFNWGSFFNLKTVNVSGAADKALNPFNFYNQLSSSGTTNRINEAGTYALEAKAALQEIQALSAIQYEISFADPTLKPTTSNQG